MSNPNDMPGAPYEEPDFTQLGAQSVFDEGLFRPVQPGEVVAQTPPFEEWDTAELQRIPVGQVDPSTPADVSQQPVATPLNIVPSAGAKTPGTHGAHRAPSRRGTAAPQRKSLKERVLHPESRTGKFARASGALLLAGIVGAGIGGVEAGSSSSDVAQITAKFNADHMLPGHEVTPEESIAENKKLDAAESGAPLWQDVEAWSIYGVEAGAGGLALAGLVGMRKSRKNKAPKPSIGERRHTKRVEKARKILAAEAGQATGADTTPEQTED